MFATISRSLLCLAALIQHSLPIPLTLDGRQDLSFDDGSSFAFLPEIPSETGSNDLFASSANEGVENPPSDFNLLDYTSSENQDWTSYLSSHPLPTSNNGMLISDGGASCSLGKREDGGSCAPRLPNLQVPNLLENFVTISGNDQQLGSPVESGSSADTITVGLSAADPCLVGWYHLHVCCGGPVGSAIGNAFNWIENCQLGM
jgi:hypothetical protein